MYQFIDFGHHANHVYVFNLSFFFHQMLKCLAENPQGTDVPPVEGVAGGGTAYGWNDGGSSCSLKGSIDLTEVPAADLVHVWCMPSTATVGPQEMPRHLEPVSINI